MTSRETQNTQRKSTQIPLHSPLILQNAVELVLGICSKKWKSNHLSYLVAKMYGMWSVIKPGNVLGQKSVTDTTLHRHTYENCAILKNTVFTSLITVSKNRYRRLWCFKQKEQVKHSVMAHVIILQTHLRGLLETVKRYKANNDYDAALTTKNVASPILAVLR